ncbi:MAG: hypothetical protein P1U68_04855 [Verrucomicrobiales bacterium]|nr:hypothetical protein [Verrucomicrobiales bacterium]
MNLNYKQTARALEKGLTLVEISLVIGLMLGLASLATFSVGNITEWKKAREAGESLRSVYLAQKSYLADHPSSATAALTSEKLIPYLPNRAAALPSVKAADGSALTIKLDVVPPVLVKGGNTYDPSDSASDALWDVGAL